MHSVGSRRIIATRSVREYFHETVTSAASNQQLDAADETIDYVVNLLVSFTRADRLFEATPHGKLLRPLAMLYVHALQATSTGERNRTLQRLGDVALFMAGLFADSLNRKLIDIDYYIAMGGNAYSFLAERHAEVEGASRDVFEELGEKFVHVVDVLMEVAEQGRPACQSDVLRLYDLWLKTGSKRAAGQLRNLGIYPLASSVVRH